MVSAPSLPWIGSALARAASDSGPGQLDAPASSAADLSRCSRRPAADHLPAGASTVESRAAVGEPTPSLALAAGLQSAAFGTGLPSNADALAALAGNTDVDIVLDPAHALGLVVLGGGVASDADATSITFDSSVAFQLDLSQLSATGQLVVGLLDPELDGAGFDSLQFQILREGVAAVSETFLDVASALAYFDDQVLDLGGIADGVSGDLDLSFLLSLTSDDPGAAFRTNLIFGNVPEPATALLLGAALAALALRERQRSPVRYSASTRSMSRSWRRSATTRRHLARARRAQLARAARRPRRRAARAPGSRRAARSPRPSR